MQRCSELGCRAMPLGQQSRSHCTVCHRDFKSHVVGDEHRVGPHDGGRRCRTDDEMHEKGWQLDSNGWWGFPPMTDDERARRGF